MSNDKIGKTIGLVSLGAVTDTALIYATNKLSTQGVTVDKINLNVPIAMGALASLAEIAAGMTTKHKSLTLVGAGSLAATLGVLVGDILTAYNPLNASASANSANTTYAGLDNPKPSPFALPAHPQQTLIAGNYGGGTTYKTSVVSKPNGVNANATQLFV